jgi:hypothetical protein
MSPFSHHQGRPVFAQAFAGIEADELSNVRVVGHGIVSSPFVLNPRSWPFRAPRPQERVAVRLSGITSATYLWLPQLER